MHEAGVPVDGNETEKLVEHIALEAVHAGEHANGRQPKQLSFRLQ